MRTYTCLALLSLVALSPLPAYAQSETLSGLYRVEGHNAKGQNAYRGEAVIAPVGNVYRIAWRFGNQVQEGTGILQDNKLAVVYQLNGYAGVALYDVRGDGTLVGTWALHGQQEVGTERLTPEGRT